MIERNSNSVKGQYTVLIVCEGKNTEPAYFAMLQRHLNQNYSGIYPQGISFTIFPFPPEEKEIKNKADQFFTRTKKERELENPEKIINEDIEDEYRTEPIRWVRYAQKRGANSGFNEVWSVFDYDNRSDSEIKRAYHLSSKEELDFGKVDIAFSSYSFEYWLLLHYERFELNLPSSECKDEQNDEINCGSKDCENKGNCQGSKCIGGYLRSKQYEVGFYNKTKESTFPALIDKMKIAHFNANYIRRHPKNNGLNIWEMKPVTTMDIFIDKLVQQTNFVVWHYEVGRISIKDFELIAQRNNNDLEIKIVRSSNNTIIIPINNIKLYNETYVEYPVNSRVAMTTENEYRISINIAHTSVDPKYISVERDRRINIVEIKMN